MTIYITIIAVLVLIPMVIGIAHLARNVSEKRARQRVRGRGSAGPGVKKVTPVTLDRSPDMPHRPGATS